MTSYLIHPPGSALDIVQLNRQNSLHVVIASDWTAKSRSSPKVILTFDWLQLMPKNVTLPKVYVTQDDITVSTCKVQYTQKFKAKNIRGGWGQFDSHLRLLGLTSQSIRLNGRHYFNLASDPMLYNTLSESVLVLLRSFTGDSICEKTKFQKLNRLARI